ncbi:MAG: hypothetical protein ACI4QT_07800 [Kiritimatiellia bacterium]
MRFRFPAFRCLVFVLFFGMSSYTGASVSAVLSVQAKLSELEYVRGEDILLTVQIQNTGTSVFVVDDYGEYLKNKVSLVVREAESQRLLSPIQGETALAPVATELTVPPGDMREVTVNLSHLYDLSKHGRYQVTVLLERGAETAVSRILSFSLVEGIEIISARNAFSSDEAHSYTFTLLYWERSKRQDLFLRISDPARRNRIAAFVSLGPLVRVSDPTMTFQGTSSVTIVQQTGRDHYARTVLDISRLPVRVVDREDNLLSGEALEQQIQTQTVTRHLLSLPDKAKPKKSGKDYFGH